MYKTKIVPKSLNPVWEQTFALPIEDPRLPVTFRVYDHDTFSDDDFMGKASLDINQLEEDRYSQIARLAYMYSLSN